MQNMPDFKPFIRVLCPYCQTAYRIPIEKVSSTRSHLSKYPNKFKTKCLKCHHPFIFLKESPTSLFSLEEPNPKKVKFQSSFQVSFIKSRYLLGGFMVLLIGWVFYGFYDFFQRGSSPIKSLRIFKKTHEVPKEASIEESLQDYYEKGRQSFLLDTEITYSNAELHYLNGLKLDPRNPLLLAALAENYAAWGQIREDVQTLEKAYQLVKDALSIEPGLAEGYRAIARLLKYHRQYDESERIAKKALELKPDADTYYVLGNLALARGEDYGTAYVYLKKALEGNPDLVQAYTDLSLLLNDLELYTEAAGYAYKGLELSPEHLHLKVNLGWAYKGNGYYNAAIQIYQNILKSLPDHLQTLRDLGEIYNILGNYDQASWYLNQLIKLSPYEASGYALLGDSYLGKKEDKIAIQMYQKAIDLSPHQAIYRYKLGNAYVRQNKFKLAASTYQKGLELSEERFLYYLAMGKMYLEQKAYQPALESYQQAFFLQPRHKEVLEGLITTYEAINETKEADFYKQILELPELGKIPGLIAGGLRCLEKKAFQLAIFKFQEVLELDKSYAQARYYLGRAYEWSGDHNLALSAYISSINGEGPLSLEAKHHILDYLRTRPSTQGVLLLKYLIKNDPTPEIRIQAANILQKTQSATSAPFLIEILNQSVLNKLKKLP